MYNKTVTVSYNGNSNTGGSTSSHSGTAYRNYAGTIINASFTLKSNGFSRTNYTFACWTQGSTSGTVQKVGVSVSLNSDTTFYAYWVQTTTTYNYTGGIQTLTAPATGTYKLEVWGAQGGGVRSYDYGGNGGYSQGMVQLTAGQKIYIVVGGKGTTAQSAYISTPGGYNGGGKGHSTKSSSGRWPICGAGGGATHIATASGLLSELSSNKESVLIVAGGGGGAGGKDGWNDDGSGAGTQVRGGTGGGTTGGAGIGDSGRKGLGGTQTAGGAANLGVATTAGTFGKGGCGDNTYTQFSGGGGGYYGGSAGYYTASAGGGSGYIGGVSGGVTQNGKQSGNGRAIITFVSAS